MFWREHDQDGIAEHIIVFSVLIMDKHSSTEEIHKEKVIVTVCKCTTLLTYGAAITQ